MDFFCINFVFTLLEASKWDSFKKFCCIYIYQYQIWDVLYTGIFFVISWWRQATDHLKYTSHTLFTMFVHKALHICHNISYTDANPEIWYWILFALACLSFYA